MANNASSTSNIDYTALLNLTQKTGLYVSCGTLYYVNGYRVMLNNQANTKWKAYFKTVNGCELWTEIKNVTLGDKVTFFIKANCHNFVVVFKSDELSECYQY